MTELDFEQVVKAHYASLYRFALSLAESEDKAGDLTQQVFYIWARRGHQLRDSARVKSWLFTTLYREFLSSQRHAAKFAHHDLLEVEAELPQITADVVDRMDAALVMAALARVEEVFRTPLVLFYLEDYSYKEIAEVLSVPPGTVMSRIARGKEHVRRLLSQSASAGNTPPTAVETRALE